MAKKGKKSKFKITLWLTLPFVIILLVLVAGAASSSVSTEGGRQESVVTAQTSNLSNYLDYNSHEEKALLSAVKSEIEYRYSNDIQGGDAYIKSLKPSRYVREKALQQRAAKTESNPNPEDKPLNIGWQTYFVGQMMKNSGIDMSPWAVNISTFATKLHLNGKFVIDPNYIPRNGDIVFFGKPIKHLSDGEVIKPRYCGIVTKVEIITEKTLIKAMRLTVAEGDVEGSIVNGLYNHGTTYVKEHIYDLYDTSGNNYHSTQNEYEPIMGYGILVNDKKSYESTDDISDYKRLVYQINLTSTYDRLIKEETDK